MFKGQHHESRKSLSLLLTLEHAYCKKSQLLRGTFCFTQVQGPNALTTLLHLADDLELTQYRVVFNTVFQVYNVPIPLRVVLQSGYIFAEDLNVINKKHKWNCS